MPIPGSGAPSRLDSVVFRAHSGPQSCDVLIALARKALYNQSPLAQISALPIFFSHDCLRPLLRRFVCVLTIPETPRHVSITGDRLKQFGVHVIMIVLYLCIKKVLKQDALFSLHKAHIISAIN